MAMNKEPGPARDMTFVEALAVAQSQMDNAALNKINPHFKSKYADLAGVRAATLPTLTKYGFAIIQSIEVTDNTMYLKTELAHKSGESRVSLYPIAPGTPQQQGSAITYARRYSWSAMCGIASEEDDDANAAQGATSALKANPNYGLKNASQLRKAGTWPVFEKEIRTCPSLAGLRSLWLNWQDEIKSWPAEHRVLAEEEKDRRKLELADELPITEQLEESLADD